MLAPLPQPALGPSAVHMGIPQSCRVSSLSEELATSPSRHLQPQLAQLVRAAFTEAGRDAPLQGRLAFLVAALRTKFWPGTLALVQVWTSSVGNKWSGLSKQYLNTVVMQTHNMPFTVDNPRLQALRLRSAEHGITGAALGMLGKVWSSGALQVVQNLHILPQSVHPRNKLDEEAVGQVAELIYMPLYDLTQPATAGVAAVLEVLVASGNAQPMVVANVISAVGDILNSLQLSLAKPEAAALHAAAAKRNGAGSMPLPVGGATYGVPGASWPHVLPVMGARPPVSPAVATTVLAPTSPPGRNFSMARTASTRRLDSLQDVLMIGQVDSDSHCAKSYGPVSPLPALCTVPGPYGRHADLFV